MRFKSVLFAPLCLPLLAVATVLSPVIVPAMMLIASVVPGLAVFKRTSAKRSWNLASYHSPHSLTWRWLINLSLGSVFSRPRLFWSPSFNEHFGTPNPFVSFAFCIGIAGAHAYTTNYGWQFGVTFLGMHVHFSQQRPMWYRDMIQRAWDEKDAVASNNARLRAELAEIKHNAARASLSEVPAHLN